MAELTKASSDPAYEARLRVTLEGLLTRAFGHPASVRSIGREPSPFATLFPAEILTVRLRSGEEVAVFLKQLGNEQAEHPDKQQRDREIRIYEELLGDAGLPVVKYYGSFYDKTSRRREVFLEYVDDWNLKYHELEHWYATARQLAHLHAYFGARAEQLLGCEFLLRLDALYFCQWAERALSAVSEQSARLANSLVHVVEDYDRVAGFLSQQPVTLVHNDLSPKNVLVARSRNPARICIVDWELAGIGCGVLDLVHLKYGLKPSDEEKMRDAYCSALAGTDLLPTNPDELGSLFAACELHETLYRLAFSKEWQLPIEAVTAWVREAEQFLCRV